MSVYDEELLSREWGPSRTPVVTPERMIAMNHEKARRLVGGMILKYSLLLPYLEPNSRVLDMCCGAAWGAGYLASNGHSVTGVDRLVWHSECRDNIDFIKLNVLEGSWSFNDFGAAICVDAIEHFKQEDQSEVVRRLGASAPGGYILMDTPLAEFSHRTSRDHQWELSWDDFGTLMQDNLPSTEWIKRFSVTYEHGYPLLMTTVPELEVYEKVDQIIVVKLR